MKMPHITPKAPTHRAPIGTTMTTGNKMTFSPPGKRSVLADGKK